MGKKLFGKTIVISGGMGYLGQAACKQLAKDGFNVAFLYNSHSKEEALNFEKQLGQNSRGYNCDIRNYSQVRAVLKKVEKDFGGIFGCVHAAWGKITIRSILKVSEEEMLEEIQNNFIPAFNFLEHCAALLIKSGGGVIIGVTSARVVVENDAKSMGAYIPSKFALQGLLAAMRLELGTKSIRVYALAPGFMEGGINKNVPQAFKDILKRNSKTQKLTNVELVAKKISSLCTSKTKVDKLTIIVAEEHGILE